MHVNIPDGWNTNVVILENQCNYLNDWLLEGHQEHVYCSCFIFFLWEAGAESRWLSPAAPWRWAVAVWKRTPHSPYNLANAVMSEAWHIEPVRVCRRGRSARCLFLEQNHLLYGINVKVSFKRHQLWCYPGLFMWDLHWVNLILNYCLLSHQSSGTTHDLIAQHLCCLVTTNRE